MHFLFSTGKYIHLSRFMKFNFSFCFDGRRFVALLAFLAVMGLWAGEVAAQSALDARDLSTVRVEMISDEQLTVWLRRAEAEGYSIDEILMLASQRGLPASQQQLLRVRLQDLRMARPNLDATDAEVDDVSAGEEEPQSTRARQPSTGGTPTGVRCGPNESSISRSGGCSALVFSVNGKRFWIRVSRPQFP
jgi:hypothetical protein